MAIFRRRSKAMLDHSNASPNTASANKNTHTRPSKTTVTTPVLEASLSPTALWRSFLHFHPGARNVVLAEHDDDYDDDSSCTTSFRSNSSHLSSSSNPSVVFEECTVKIDPYNDRNVLLSLDVPSGVAKEELSVHLEDGILQVLHEPEATVATEEAALSMGLKSDEHQTNGTSLIITPSTATTGSPVVKHFQMDEQALELHNITADFNRDSRQLVIRAPIKSEAQQPLTELPIQKEQSPNDATAFRIVLDLPGISSDEMHVRYANAKVQVSAQRQFGSHRSFKRTLTINTQHYDAQHIQVFLYKGQLTVMVPRRTERFSRIIQIAGPKAGASNSTKQELVHLDVIDESSEDEDQDDADRC